MTKKFYKVTAKCGHVGRHNYILIEYPVSAFNAKDAAKYARQIPRVKHDHKDAIREVVEISRDEYIELKRKNDEDEYLNCHSKQEQKLYCQDLSGRLYVDDHKGKYDKDYDKRDKKVIAYKNRKNELRNQCRYMDWAYDIA